MMLLMNLSAAAELPNIGNFVANLRYMGLGMLGIFIVMGAIILATLLLNRVFSDKNKQDDQ
ncbi:MAG: hypothetical protein IKD37_02325 [Clostridia bacterium]|nr:hypothetical protein [Clostridia bacterium]